MQSMMGQCIRVMQIQQIQAHINKISFQHYISAKLNKSNINDGEEYGAGGGGMEMVVYQASIDDIRREIAKT